MTNHVRNLSTLCPTLRKCAEPSSHRDSRVFWWFSEGNGVGGDYFNLQSLVLHRAVLLVSTFSISEHTGLLSSGWGPSLICLQQLDVNEWNTHRCEKTGLDRQAQQMYPDIQWRWQDTSSLHAWCLCPWLVGDISCIHFSMSEDEKLILTHYSYCRWEKNSS